MVMLLATAVVTVAARLRPGTWIVVLCRGVALVLLLTEPGYWLAQIATHQWLTSRDLPLQLSDAAVFVSAAALWWRTALLVELTYFWGLGAVLQALLTPDLAQHFPDLDFILFYLAHGGVLLAALLLTAGLRITPRPGAPRRVLLVTVVYTGFVAVLDALGNWNYMYLRAKPAAGTVLNFLGPWPWYIGAGLLLAVGIVTLLYSPFWLTRRFRARSTAANFLAMLCT